ncbi:hypothetical protein AAZV13_11G084200 [Glycine max]
MVTVKNSHLHYFILKPLKNLHFLSPLLLFVVFTAGFLPFFYVQKTHQQQRKTHQMKKTQKLRQQDLSGIFGGHPGKGSGDLFGALGGPQQRPTSGGCRSTVAWRYPTVAKDERSKLKWESVWEKN